MSSNKGGPAFPVTLFEGQALGDGIANGMALRDYFAAKAMQAMISKSPYVSDFCGEDDPALSIAQGSYSYADAMLKAREVAK